MKKNYFLRVVFTVLLCSFFSLSYAANIYLKATGGIDTNDGLTAETAVASFTKAQELVGAAEIIYVSGLIDFSLEPSLVQPVGVAITKSLTIQGTSNTTDGFDGKGLTRFFSILNFNVTLKNLKLINGNSGSNNGGALIVNTGSNSLTCENVIFDGNKTGMNTVFTGANKTGAAIHFDNVNGATFKNCVFSNNEASKAGAIYITAWAASSTILFEGCAFVGNIAKESFGGSALYIRANTSTNTTLSMINCTIKGNHVNTLANGGAVNFGGKAPNTTIVNMINCTVSGNTTAGSANNCAGVFFNNSDANLDGSFYIKNCIIEGNTTTNGIAADLNLSALSATAPVGTTGYMSLQNSIIGYVATPANIPAGNIVASTHFNYLTSTSTTNDLKASLAPFNASTNSFPLYAGSAAIGYGNSTFLTSLSPAITTDQLGNVRTVGATNYAGAWESTPIATTTPSSPTALVATAGDGQVSVAFKSAATGGSLVTNYKYSVNDGAYVALDPAVTTSPIVITGLTNNTEYTVKLKAVNANGDSPESVISNAVTPTGTTGLDNTINKITIFKNSNNQIVVNSASQKAGTVTVCNAIGQRVASVTLNASTTIINKSFTSGAYLVMLNVEGKTRSTKIIL